MEFCNTHFRANVATAPSGIFRVGDTFKIVTESECDDCQVYEVEKDFELTRMQDLLGLHFGDSNHR